MLLDRKLFSDVAGMQFIRRLAQPDDLESLRVNLTGKHFCIASAAAAFTYLEQQLNTTFYACSMRITFQPSDGSMLIDNESVKALELLHNLRQPKQGASLLSTV